MRRYSTRNAGRYLAADLKTNFLGKVDQCGPVPAHRPDLGPCWVWTAAHANGYGYMWDGERVRPAHIISYEVFIGPVPAGLELDHLCRIRLCVNWQHLEAVPHRINVRRGAAAETNRARGAAQTHCKHGHPFDEANTVILPNGNRGCRICRTDAAYRHYHRTHPDAAYYGPYKGRPSHRLN